MSEQRATADTQNGQRVPAIRAPGRWKLTLLGVLILVCGMVIGSAGTLIITRRLPNFGLIEAVLHPGRRPDMMVEGMRRDLGLSPQQVEQIEQILTKRFRILDEIREEQRPRMDEQLRLLQEEVEKVLDKKQTRKWREQLGDRLRRRPPPHGGEPGPPGPPPGPPHDHGSVPPGARPGPGP